MPHYINGKGVYAIGAVISLVLAIGLNISLILGWSYNSFIPLIILVVITIATFISAPILAFCVYVCIASLIMDITLPLIRGQRIRL